MLRNRKAQAILELAILGSLLIMAFSIAISYGERYNREQSYMQQTFRATLKKAFKDNNSTNWSTLDFRRSSNMTNPLELGAIQSFSSSNNVLWSNGKKDAVTKELPKNKSWYQFNRGDDYVEVNVPLYDNPGATVIVGSSFQTSPDSTTTFYVPTPTNKDSTNKGLTAKDTLTMHVKTVGDDITHTDTLGNGGADSGGFYRGGDLSNWKEMK